MSLRRDSANFTAHCWLSEERCVVGSEGGELLLIENMDFKTVIYPCGNDNEDLVPILSLSPTTRGFVVGTVSAELRVFEKAEESREQYTFEQLFVLPGETSSSVLGIALAEDDALVCLTDSQVSLPRFITHTP